MRFLSLPCLMLAAAFLLVGCGSMSGSKPSSHPAHSTSSRLSPGQANDIAIHALSLVGTPYHYGGNTPESGFDCSGLIGYVFHRRTGVVPPRTVAQLNSFGESVSANELRTGDLVMFGGRRPSHAGIYVGEGRFVHAPSSGGTVRLDSLQSHYWSRQRQSFRRP